MNVTDTSGVPNFPSVFQTLRDIVRKNPAVDPDLLMDLYVIVSTPSGVPFRLDEEILDEIDRTDPNFWTMRHSIAQRKDYLDALAQTNYCEHLRQMGDSMKAILTFVDHVNKAFEARKKCYDGKSPIDASSGGYEGGLGEDELDALSQASDLDRASFMMDELTQFHEVVEDEGMAAYFSGCGIGRQHFDIENPSGSLAKAVIKYGVELPSTYPILFEWYTKIMEEMGVASIKPVDAEEDKSKSRLSDMEDYSQLSTVDASEVAQETFEKRLVDKELTVTQHQEDKDGTSHVFVLLDVSGSMMCSDVGGRICRAFVANVLTLAILNLAMKGRYKVWVVPFTGNVGQVVSADDRDSALKAMQWLGRQIYSGSSTDIQGAVLWAYKALAQDPTYKKADICLITDGCSPISTRLVSEKPRATKLRTLVIGTEVDYGGHAANLRKASDSYSKVTWDNSTNTFGIGDTVKGIVE